MINRIKPIVTSRIEVNKSSCLLGDPPPDPRFLASLGALTLVKLTTFRSVRRCSHLPSFEPPVSGGNPSEPWTRFAGPQIPPLARFVRAFVWMPISCRLNPSASNIYTRRFLSIPKQRLQPKSRQHIFQFNSLHLNLCKLFDMLVKTTS
jgi:hypothetical protein